MKALTPTPLNPPSPGGGKGRGRGEKVHHRLGSIKKNLKPQIHSGSNPKLEK
jgi:hypothetical protein